MNSPTSNMSARPGGRREEEQMSQPIARNQSFAAPKDHLASTNDPETIDRARVFHPSTHLAQFARGEAPSRIVTGGQGITILDRDGRRSLDAFAGLYCVNVGYGRTEIADAIHA